MLVKRTFLCHQVTNPRSKQLHKRLAFSRLWQRCRSSGIGWNKVFLGKSSKRHADGFAFHYQGGRTNCHGTPIYYHYSTASERVKRPIRETRCSRSLLPCSHTYLISKSIIVLVRKNCIKRSTSMLWTVRATWTFSHIAFKLPATCHHGHPIGGREGGFGCYLSRLLCVSYDTRGECTYHCSAKRVPQFRFSHAESKLTVRGIVVDKIRSFRPGEAVPTTKDVIRNGA
jgi:hypothetical protein